MIGPSTVDLTKKMGWSFAGPATSFEKGLSIRNFPPRRHKGGTPLVGSASYSPLNSKALLIRLHRSAAPRLRGRNI